MESLSGMSEIDLHNQLQASASTSMQKHTEIINGLLYGILTIHTNNANSHTAGGGGGGSGPSSISATELFRHMNFVARDSLALAVRQTRYFCSLIHFHRIRPQVREQLLWLVGQLTEIKVHGVEQLYMVLLRQIRGGDTSPANVQHAEAMLRLLQSHMQPWLYSVPALIAYSCFTYLRVMLDHGRFTALRQQEATFCAKLLRDRFRDCSDVGRDLVRALQDVARIKEIEEIWVDLLYTPEKLNPQLEGIHQLMATPSKDIYLASRLTFDMEHRLLHILKHINVGNHHRNLQWFIDRFLAGPDAETLHSDIIRYICGVYHPTNAVLASSIVPRYVLIGSLIRVIRSNVAAANVKLALFYDWLFFDPARDSIMNIEPAMLLMEKSVERYPYITAILLEFLHFTVENYYPPLRDYIHKHVGMAAQAIVDKGVIRSFRLMYRAQSLGEYHPVRDYMLSIFPAQVGDLAESAAGSTLGGTSTESADDHHSATQAMGEGSESVDEFETSPPHSGYMAQGIAGEDDDDEARAEGRRSRSLSRESSREPMQTDGEGQTESLELDEEGGQDEIMESSSVDLTSQQQQHPQPPKLQNPSVLSDWTITDDISSEANSGKDIDSASVNAAPIPGASLWIFGSSLQEFKKAFEADSEAPETAIMFQRIWEVYGDVAGAGVEPEDMASEIGQEICALTLRTEVPATYVVPVGVKQMQEDNNAGAMDVLISCLWRATQRDGTDGALRVAQVFLRSEAEEDPGMRLLGMWYLIGLVRGQQQKALGAQMSMEQALQLYATYINASVKQDLEDQSKEEGANVMDDPAILAQKYLVRDLQLLQDQQLSVFEAVLPLVLQHLPDLVPRSEAFLRLVLALATPAQIYRLSMGLFRREFSLLSIPTHPQDSASTSLVKEEMQEAEGKRRTKTTRTTKRKPAHAHPQEVEEVDSNEQSVKDPLEPKITRAVIDVLGETLEWESYEQLGVWQLAQSEIGGVSDAVATLLSADWIPEMNIRMTAEALSGVLNLVHSLTLTPPTVRLGRAVVRIASQTELLSDEMKEFCETSVARWANGYPDHLAAILLSLCERTAEPVETLSTSGTDGDMEMEDVSFSKPVASSKGAGKNTRAKNGSAAAAAAAAAATAAATATAKTELNPKQRREQAIQLRVALMLFQAWWSNVGSSPLAPTQQQFLRIWSTRVKEQVQEALTESFGASEKSSWPKEWWVKAEDGGKSWRKNGKRVGTRDSASDNDGSSSHTDDDDREGEPENSEDEDEAGVKDSNDDNEDENDDKMSDVDNESEEEQQSSDSDKRTKDRKRFGGAAGSTGSSRRNSPKIASGAAAFANNNSSSQSTKKGPITGSVAAGVLNSRSRGKNSPAPTANNKKPVAKKGGSNRKRRVSEDEQEEEEEEQDDDAEGEEEDAEEEDDDNSGQESEVEEEEEEEEKEAASKKTRSKKAAKKSTKATVSKTRSSSRNKVTKPAATRNGRRRQIKDEDEEDEEKSDDNSSEEEEEDENGDDQDDEEGDQGSDQDQDGSDDDQDDDDEELEKGKLPLYSQRRAAASANSKLMTKASPASSSSSSASSSGIKSKAATAKRRGKRRIPSDDESDD
ncbi:Integrator complex subunit 3 [Dissophora globulifera]|nr:Integrator complex subunit 3 [Dissophora globulifera]